MPGSIVCGPHSRKTATHRVSAIALAALALLVMGATPAWSAPITYQYSGGVVSNSVAGGDAQFLGQDWTATLTFDSATPATSSAPLVFPNPTIYLDGISSFEIEFSSGVSWSVVGSSGQILQVTDDWSPRPNLTSDRFAVRASFTDTAAALPAVGQANLFLTLIDYGHDVFSSDSLPLTALDVNAFDVSLGTLSFAAGGSVGLDIDSITLEVPGTVPEPTSAILLGLGLIGLSAAGNRAKQP